MLEKYFHYKKGFFTLGKFPNSFLKCIVTVHYGVVATVQKKIRTAKKKIHVGKGQFQMKVNQDEDKKKQVFLISNFHENTFNIKLSF